MTIDVIFMILLVGWWGFLFGQIWEGDRERRNARRQAMRELEDRILFKLDK